MTEESLSFGSKIDLDGRPSLYKHTRHACLRLSFSFLSFRLVCFSESQRVASLVLTSTAKRKFKATITFRLLVTHTIFRNKPSATGCWGTEMLQFTHLRLLYRASCGYFCCDKQLNAKKPKHLNSCSVARSTQRVIKSRPSPSAGEQSVMQDPMTF